MKSKVRSIIICIAMLMCFAVSGTLVIGVNASPETGTLLDELKSSKSVEQMYALVLDAVNGADESRKSELMALTYDELEELRDIVNGLDPEGDDADTADMLDTLSALPNAVCPDCDLIGDHEADCSRGQKETLAVNDFQTAYNSIQGGTDSKTMSGEYVLNGDVYIDKIILVPAGETLKITGSGTIRRTGHSKESGLDMFQLVERSKLIIGEKDQTSTAKNTIVLDGEDAIVHRPLILAYNGGDVELYHVTLQNNRNRGAVSSSFRGSSFGGGAIYIAPCYKTVNDKQVLDYAPSVKLYSCSIKDCSSYNYGGGIYSQGCDINLENSEILRCNAVGAIKYKEDGKNYDAIGGLLQSNGLYHADRGAGGGINLLGITSYDLRPTCTIRNSDVCENTSVGYGGGIEIRNGASVIMYSGSMNDNTSLNRGAGALHVTADASFTMYDGEMLRNVCYEVGGAIHTSYTCVLNLNGGLIKDNIAYGRGGGIHVDVGGDLVLNGTDIIDNHAYASVELNGTWHDNIGVSNIVGGVYADALGNIKSDPIWWGQAQYRGEAGYGGGVLIDCGTCTMNDGTVSGNTADVGGGGLCFVMLLISTDDRFGQTGVSGFEMTGGQITGNHSEQNGGGVYLMRNVLTVETVAASFGGTYSLTDGGVIFYNSEGDEIEMKRADGTVMTPQDTKALFDAVPVVEIKGGTIEYNEAKESGGGIYQEENTEFHISGTGNISNNEAADGAGVYIAKGTAYVEGGTMNKNTASNNGGAIYVNGTVNMTGGIIGGSDEGAKNTAINGGGVYVNDGNFNMISGSLIHNAAASYGGGAFVHGGNITIGVSGCEATGINHSNIYTDKTHPEVKNNDAVFGGGLGVDGGKVDIHCGRIVDNTAMNNGTGTNIFMYDSSGEDKGEINHNSGTIGEETNHGMVVIGGDLNVNTDGVKIKIKYHSNEDDFITLWIGYAPKDYYLNLPYCPQDWENAQNPEYTFAGWTFDSNAEDQPGTIIDLDHIRDKNDYKALGEPVQIKEIAGNIDANELYVDFYAVWAPKNNTVDYEIFKDDYGIDGEVAVAMTNSEKANNTQSYIFSYQQNATITMTNPTIAGYTFKGWRVTPSEEKISNWSIKEDNAGINDESVEYLIDGTTSGKAVLADYNYAYSADGKTFTLVTDRNFGNIKLTALFVEDTVDYTYILVGPVGKNYGELTAAPAIKQQDGSYKITAGVVNGIPGTATASANYGFKVNGWYTDSVGSDNSAVDSSWVANKIENGAISQSTIAPDKVNGFYQGGTFYAVIDYHLADLIISKTANGAYSGEQTFIFEVYEGDNLLTTVSMKAGESVTIKDLIIGTEYTVKEMETWSWRFDDGEQSWTMVPVAESTDNTNIVSFTNVQEKDEWLTADYAVLNKRKKSN